MRISAMFWGFVLCAASASPLGAGPKMTMKVFPSVSFAPANFVVQAMVESNRENRAIEVIADSPDYFRSSTIGLDGASAPRTTQIEFRSLPGGTYSVRATLYGPSGQELAAARQIVNVIPSAGRR